MRPDRVQLLPALVVLLSIVVAGPAWAGNTPAVGDKAPDFEGKTDLDGKPLNLKQHQGHVVLLDFWATWCPPCRAELPNVIKVYEKYHAQGFEIVGISLDQDKHALTSYITEHKMTWRQYFDGKGWENEISKQYGITGIPAAFLLDDQGIVRYANVRGEGPLEDAVKDLLSKVAPDPESKTVTEAEALIEAKDYKKAVGLLKGVASGKSRSAARAHDVLAALDKSVGEPRLADARKLLADKKHREALDALRALADDLEGCDSAAAARKEIARIQGLPEVKELLGREKDEKKAGDVLARARDLEAKQDLVGAFGLYETLAKDFADTAAGRDAARRLGELRGDEALMAKIKAEQARRECEGWLKSADNYAKNGMADKAREVLKKLIDKYPDTEYAKQAKDKLAGLKD